MLVRLLQRIINKLIKQSGVLFSYLSILLRKEIEILIIILYVIGSMTVCILLELYSLNI